MLRMLHAGVAVLLLCVGTAFGGEELRVLPDDRDGVPPKERMQEFLLGRIAEQWKLLTAGYEARTTPEAVDAALQEGFPVLAVDLRGTGETEPESQEKGYEGAGGEWKDYFRAYVLGRSYVGMRAEDILVCARHLKAQGLTVHLQAFGTTGVPALHAAALEPELFASVKLSGTVTSWADVPRAKPAKKQLVNAVHGALKVYDLPDLTALLGAKLTVEHPADAQGNGVGKTE